jgi:tetratricopeptide (TPR) repeat protein
MQIIKKRFSPLLIGLSGILLLAIVGGAFPPTTIFRNMVHLQVLQSSFSMDRQAKTIAADLLKQQASSDCRNNWLLSQLYDDQEQQTSIYQTVMACSQDYWPLVLSVRPTNLALATQAVELKPQDSSAWLWLARSQDTKDPNVALPSYLKVVNLNQYNGLAWCRIGTIYWSQSKFEQAKSAYLNCCKNEDPGGNGCFNAGRMAETLGDPRQAIEYYRMSKFDDIIKLAAELEKKIKP